MGGQGDVTWIPIPDASPCPAARPLRRRECQPGRSAAMPSLRLDAFGSALRDDFRPDESDLDLLVEFGPMEPYDRVDAYFGLLEELRSLLGSKIDLVMVGAIKNPYITSDIDRTRQMLYAA